MESYVVFVLGAGRVEQNLEGKRLGRQILLEPRELFIGAVGWSTIRVKRAVQPNLENLAVD